ncbi:MAG: hypothetical protein ACI83Q_000071 [Colwellia polaris]|jgi:hypothetical protein
MPLGRLIFGQGGLIAMDKAGKAAERLAEYLEDEQYDSVRVDRHTIDRPGSSEEDYSETNLIPKETYDTVFIPEGQEPGLVPVENYTIFSQNPEENNKGGDNIMTELESDYFQERGASAVEAIEGDSADDYSDEELEAYGVALDLWLAENGQIEEVSDGDLAAYAQDQGLLTEVMAAKETYQDHLNLDGAYEELLDQTEERTGDAGHAVIEVQQLEYFVDRMSEGTERVAQAHEETEPTYELLRETLSSGADTIDTAVDRLLSAGESKGVDMGRPEDLETDIEYLQILNQSIDDAEEELENRQEDGEDIDFERLRRLEERTQDRKGMGESLDRLED